MWSTVTTSASARWRSLSHSGLLLSLSFLRRSYFLRCSSILCKLGLICKSILRSWKRIISHSSFKKKACYLLENGVDLLIMIQFWRNVQVLHGFLPLAQQSLCHSSCFVAFCRIRIYLRKKIKKQSGNKWIINVDIKIKIWISANSDKYQWIGSDLQIS